MGDIVSFGGWVQKRRNQLRYSRTALAKLVICSPDTIKKIERDERRPSLEIAELLAEHLQVPETAYANFIRLARGEYVPQMLALESDLTADTFDLPTSVPLTIDDHQIHLVAREQEIEVLDHSLKRVIAGQGTAVFIKGSAGSGKSALMNAFSQRTQQDFPDLVVTIGNCNAHAGMGDPYLPFRDILNLLSGNVEGKRRSAVITQMQAQRLMHSAPLTIQTLMDNGTDLIGTFVTGKTLLEKSEKLLSAQTGLLHRVMALVNNQIELTTRVEQQNALFVQYTQVLLSLSQNKPLILLLDDLQWADRGSVNLLFHLGRKLAEGRILLVGAFREDEVLLRQDVNSGNGRHPLLQVVNELQRIYGNPFITLDKEDEAERRNFVSAFLDSEPNLFSPAFQEALFQHTKGHPLFTVELLRHLQDKGDLVQDENGRWQTAQSISWHDLPTRIGAVIEERISRVATELRDLLTVASVEGEDFTAQVIANVQSVENRGLLRQISRELDKKHHLVGEKGSFDVSGRRLHLFQFRHSLYQRHLYNSLLGVEKELLHGDVGQALEWLYEDEVETIAPQLAWHFKEAGETEKAIRYTLLSGDRARQFYAHQEASLHYQEAIQLLRQTNQYEKLARTLMKLGLTYHNDFAFKEAQRAYDEGFTIWQRLTDLGVEKNNQPAPHPLRLATMEPLTLDPGNYYDDASATVIYHLFSGLVELNAEMNVVPDVAFRWELLDEGRRYIFHLRDDVYWTDGVQVTAHDFEYAWQRLIHPQRSERHSAYLFDVVGAKAFNKEELSDVSKIGVRARNAVTLEVELIEQTSYFPQLMTVALLFPVPRHVVERHGDVWWKPETIVTNGAFRLATWEIGNTAVLERNPNYYGRFRGNIEQVILHFDEKENKELEGAYKTGQLDAFNLTYLPWADRERVRQKNISDYLTGPILSTAYVGMKTVAAPLNDLKVRQALTLAVDREKLAGIADRGVSFAATGGLVPPGMPGHHKEIGFPYDPALARKLLAEAGFPNGEGFPCLTAVHYNHSQQITPFLSAQWRENLNIEIEWSPLSWENLTHVLNERVPDLWILGWSADYPDPDNFLRLSGIQGFTQWENQAYVELVENGRRVSNQEERLKIYQKAEQQLIDSAVILPLVYKRFHLLLQPWIKQFPTSPIIRNDWKDVIIEPH
ncbi:MAG: ABC transporter substrate-binding protein [Chloroflexota bacterium]